MIVFIILLAIYKKNTNKSLRYDNRIQDLVLSSTGECGIFLNYSIMDQKLIIDGSGDMTNYNLNFLPPWNSLSQTIKIIELPESLTSIGSYSFYNFTNLTMITIPNNVVSIGEYAFMHAKVY